MVLCAFRQFLEIVAILQNVRANCAIVQIVRKTEETLLLGNVMLSKVQVRCKVINKTLLYQFFVLVVYPIFSPKWIKIIIVPLFPLKIDDVTVTIIINFLAMYLATKFHSTKFY